MRGEILKQFRDKFSQRREIQRKQTRRNNEKEEDKESKLLMAQRFNGIEEFNFYKRFIIDEDTKVRIFDQQQIEETNRMDEQIRNDRKNDLEFVNKYYTEKSEFLKQLKQKKETDYQKIYDKISIKNALKGVSPHKRQLMKRLMS